MRKRKLKQVFQEPIHTDIDVVPKFTHTDIDNSIGLKINNFTNSVNESIIIGRHLEKETRIRKDVFRKEELATH